MVAGSCLAMMVKESNMERAASSTLVKYLLLALAFRLSRLSELFDGDNDEVAVGPIQMILKKMDEVMVDLMEVVEIMMGERTRLRASLSRLPCECVLRSRCRSNPPRRRRENPYLARP